MPTPFRFLHLSLLALLLLLASSPARALQSAPPTPTAAPAEPTSTAVYSLPPAKLAQARVLNRIRTTLDIVGSLWGLVFLWLLLARGWAARIAAWSLSVTRKRRWLQGLLFFAVFFLLSTLASLPLDAVGHAASLHYGISVQGWPGWLADQAKALGVTLIGGPLILLLCNWVVRKLPRTYWLALWVITIPLILISIYGEPLVIDPIFNKFEPLTAHHAALAQKLETLVARTGTQIPPERMFLMQASAKTHGINAYVTGIGPSKRFVLWDTTIDQLPDDETLFIFGHESGHYVLNHIPKLIAGLSAALFFIYWACDLVARSIVERKAVAWGFAESPEAVEPLATRPGFLVLLVALSVISFLIQPVSNAFGRHFEHQADVYGQEAIHGLVPDAARSSVSAFNHIGEAWLEDPSPNPLVEIWEYNHPSVQQRATFAAHYDPWANNGHGQFFRW